MKNPNLILATNVPPNIYELVGRQLQLHENKSQYVAEAIHREILRRSKPGKHNDDNILEQISNAAELR